MQHRYNFGDDRQARRRDLQPSVKGVDQLSPNIFPWLLVHVVVWTHEDLVILR